MSSACRTSRSFTARQLARCWSVASSSTYPAVTVFQASAQASAGPMAPPRRAIPASTAPTPSSKWRRSSDSPHPDGHSAAPSRGNTSNIRAHSSSGRSSRPTCFFTVTSRPLVTRARPLALAHSTTVVIPGSSSLLLVRNTRSPILGSISSSVPSNTTSSRASASVIRPVWVSLRPAPTHLVNARSRRTGSASAAVAASHSSDDVRIPSSRLGGVYGSRQTARARSMSGCTCSRASVRGTPAISSAS
jgi:hypothetical protein